MGLLTILSSLPVPVPDPGSDFYVVPCFELVLGSGDTDVTLTEGVHYSLPLNLNGDALLAEDVLVRATSSRASGRGATSGGGSQPPDSITCWIADPVTGSTGVDFIRIKRNDDATETAVTISIVCVVRPDSPSRFWVRDSAATGFSITTTVATPTLSTPFTNSAQGVVFITGQATETSTRGLAHEGKFTASISAGNPRLVRGASSMAAMCSWAAVEFGPDWSVQRLGFTAQDIGLDSGTHDLWSSGSPNVSNVAAITTLGGTALTDFTRALIETQYRITAASNQGNDDQGEVIELTGNDQLTERTATRTGNTLKTHVLWVAEWVGTGKGTPPVTELVSVFVASGAEGAEEGVIARAVTAVGVFSATSIEGASSSSDGTGAGTPRGHVDSCLVDSTTVNETRSETARSERRTYIVFQWPAGVPRSLLPRGSRSEFAVQGSEESQPATAGSLRAEAGVSGSSSAQAAAAGSLRSELGVSGSLSSEASLLR